MFQQKRMFKVISPIERRDGGKYWMRLGTGFVNKDNSINVYLDAVPYNQKETVVLQLRELTEEDLRERGDKRASYSARGTLGQSSFSDPSMYSSSSSSSSPSSSSPSSSSSSAPPPLSFSAPLSGASEDVPF